MQVSDNPSPKILVAGFGSAGRRHFRNLATLGVTDVAFYRSSQSTLSVDEIAERPTFVDLDEALAWGPDAVVVANPTSLHLPVALAAARAGADLLIEKPVAHTLEGCDELACVAAERRLVTMVGCQYRFHPLLLDLRDRLRRGDLGKPLAARAEYADSIRLWHPWEDYRRSYSARPDLGGGAILTLVHSLDYLYWLFGPVRAVHASARKADYLGTTVPDDIAQLTLAFESGLISQVHLDFVQDPPVHTLVVLCERGQAHLDFLAGTLRWQPTGGGQATVHRVPDGYERNTMFIDEMAHFLSCVRSRRQTDVPLDDGLAILAMALDAKHDAERRAR